MPSRAGQEDDRGATGRTRRRVALAASALVAVVALAWLVEWRAAGGVSTPGGAGAPPGADAAGPPAYVVEVVRHGRVVRRFTPAELSRLPQRTITSYGKEQRGPSVRAVLEAVGIGGFSRLEVRGMGLRDDGRLTLRSVQINDELILDFTDRGTLKVVSPDLDWRDRVRDVTQLRVVE